MSAPSTATADKLFEQAQTVLAAGVSAGMRVNPYLGKPLFIERGEGAHLYDVDGRKLIDFNMSNGAALLGHDHPAVKEAVIHGVELGIICAAETPFHEQLASRMVEVIPAAERVRFSSVGSEVTVVALRIARAATKRSKYLKFDGHFHGLTEQWLYKRQDPRNQASPIIPSSDGVPAEGASDVLMAPWNDVDAFEQAMKDYGDQIAAVICEPIHYNAGCIPPAEGFLELLRERTTQYGAVLIFDEVLSGFRTHIGGVSAQYGVTPDLTTHAKALANGLPLSSVSGREDLMLLLSPTGTAVHSGTYSGHLLSVLAALATLDELAKPGVYDQINATAEHFYGQMQSVFDEHGLPVRVQGMGARFGIYFGRTEPVTTWTDAFDHDHAMNQRFVAECNRKGVAFHGYTKQGPPGHAGFSLAHTQEDFDEALNVFDAVASDIAHGRTT
jgi:glutamate-1-semialdehyde 2,1-aminomutase